jgi:mono/diheme cytochrome c family protein
MVRIFSSLIAVAAFSLAAPQSHAEDSVSFSREIQPILADKCFACHGPDEAKREQDMRFDIEEGLFGKTELGAEIIASGNPEESELYFRITHDDKDERMPPSDFHLKLSPEEIELIRRWIEEGAVWEGHWAFVPPTKPSLPPVSNDAWGENGIDAYILSRLDEAGLKPNQRANRATLIRRVSLDLTGLPPTREDTEGFVSDASADAYEKVVDRLLASPHYGERMAFPWLDAARYSDTDGYQRDPKRFMSHWRDWVINAFNDNMPFDQFTIEQLAGDLLPNATLSQKIATGFNRNHRINGEGGVIPEEFAVEYVVDRVETTSTTWMGLTMGCARCHEHKFDPISQTEFYELYDFFNRLSEEGKGRRAGNERPFTLVPTRKETAQAWLLGERIAQVERQLNSPDERLDRLQRVWEERLAETFAGLDWNQIRTARATENSQAITGTPSDNSHSESDTFSRWAKPTLGTWKYLGSIKQDPGINGFGIALPPEEGFDPERTYVDDLKWKERPDFADGDTFALKAQPDSVHYVYQTVHAHADTTLQFLLDGNGGVKVWLDGSLMHSKETRRLPDEEQETVLSLALSEGDHELLIKAVSYTGSNDFRFRAYDDGGEGLVALKERIANPRNRRSAEDRDALRNRFRMQDAQWVEERHGLESLEEDLQTLNATIDTTMVMEDMDKPRDTYLLNRGAYDKPDTSKVLQASVPAALGEMDESLPKNRLGLARWLTDPKHPLTARVRVNQLWQLYFGRGLVKTTEDFGTQGSRPSHPELLDWLALEFIESGWDTKAMQKRILMSAAYRQSSKVMGSHLENDPENILLARAPRLRLSAEMLRDQALRVSGLLNTQLGGPSVMPYQPPNMWSALTFTNMDMFSTNYYKPDAGDKLYRRGLYTYWKRTIPPPRMKIFGSADRERCVVRVEVTNTPMQALALLNDPTFVEAARHLAQRMIREGGPHPMDRVRYGYAVALARDPDSIKSEILAKGLKDYRLHFNAYPKNAKAFVEIGDSTPDGSIENTELAAYTMLASVILNLDEFITRE